MNSYNKTKNIDNTYDEMETEDIEGCAEEELSISNDEDLEDEAIKAFENSEIINDGLVTADIDNNIDYTDKEIKKLVKESDAVTLPADMARIEINRVLNELKSLCQRNGIPMFAAVAIKDNISIKDSNVKTEYLKEIVTPFSVNKKLKTDYISPMMLVLNGFQVRNEVPMIMEEGTSFGDYTDQKEHIVVKESKKNVDVNIEDETLTEEEIL